jgi:hypothetical protein
LSRLLAGYAEMLFQEGIGLNNVKITVPRDSGTCTRLRNCVLLSSLVD